nr:unknown [Synechococcus elongatus PCC 7942 = FACHB-805]
MIAPLLRGQDFRNWVNSKQGDRPFPCLRKNQPRFHQGLQASQTRGLSRITPRSVDLIDA